MMRALALTLFSIIYQPWDCLSMAVLLSKRSIALMPSQIDVFQREDVPLEVNNGSFGFDGDIADGIIDLFRAILHLQRASVCLHAIAAFAQRLGQRRSISARAHCDSRSRLHQFTQRTLGDDAAIVEDDYTVGHALNIDEQMLRKNDVDSHLMGDACDKSQHLIAPCRVKPVGWL